MPSPAVNRIALFVDVQNIYYTTRDHFRRSFNYRALWQQLSERGEIVQAFAYATERHDDQQRQFQDALRHMGFEVKLKPFIQRSDGSAKGDWDVGITIDVMDCAASGVDTVVLLSGDGDFDRLLTRIRRDGIYTEVYGVPSLTARSLVHAADRFIAIDQQLLL